MIPNLYLPLSRTRTLREPSNYLGKASSSPVYPTQNLQRLLQMLSGISNPHVLDLGRLSGPNIEWLIQRGLKIYVDDRITSLEPVPHSTTSLKNEKRKPPPAPLDPLDYDPSFFHAVLCWDLFDYLVVKQAQELIADIARILKPKGLFLAFFNFNHSSSPPPVRYRILRADRLEYESLSLNPLSRRIYENREIQELFSGFDTINSCFLKNQVREVLVQGRSGQVSVVA